MVLTRKKTAYTLAEMLIVLLIIALIAIGSTPLLVKKAKNKKKSSPMEHMPVLFLTVRSTFFILTKKMIPFLIQKRAGLAANAVLLL